MKNNYNKITLNEADLIIKEYDADNDGHLSLDEFIMFALPSANQTYRDICIMRKNLYSYRPNKPLDFDCKDKLVRHFENELRLIKRRD